MVLVGVVEGEREGILTVEDGRERKDVDGHGGCLDCWRTGMSEKRSLSLRHR